MGPTPLSPYTTVDSQQKGNGTMIPGFFTAPCLHNPSDSLKVKVVGYGARGLDVNVRENGRYYAAVLSHPDATRLCAYLIEQGFGPKAEVPHPLNTPFTQAVLRGDFVEEPTIGAFADLSDAVQDAHERIDHSIEAIGENASDIRRIDNRIADILSMFNALERRLNSAASELKG